MEVDIVFGGATLVVLIILYVRLKLHLRNKAFKIAKDSNRHCKHNQQICLATLRKPTLLQSPNRLNQLHWRERIARACDMTRSEGMGKAALHSSLKTFKTLGKQCAHKPA